MDLAPIDRSDELETAMALLEKSVHEKQDTIVSLRQQIEDIKKINLDLYQKLRVKFSIVSFRNRFIFYYRLRQAGEESSKGKDKLINKLEKEMEGDKSFWKDKVNSFESE